MTATPQRNALVLGASSGIGAATAKHLAAEGFAVAVVARRAAELDSVVQDIRTRGGQAYSATYDLAVDGASTQAVQWAVEQLGQVDVVVYSAGMVRLHAADEWRRDWWERQWRLNTLAAAEAAAASVPAMRRRGSGWFIVIGSAAGLTPVPGTGGLRSLEGSGAPSRADAECREPQVWGPRLRDLSGVGAYGPRGRPRRSRRDAGAAASPRGHCGGDHLVGFTPPACADQPTAGGTDPRARGRCLCRYPTISRLLTKGPLICLP